MKNKLKKTQNEFIIGRNSIKEALNAGRSIEYILISNSAHNRIITDIITRAKKLKIPIKISDTKKLNSLCQNTNHQGIIAVVAAHKYVSIDEIFDVAHKKNEPPFIIVADEINDPHNLGAIIRSAECAGVHGIIIPNRKASGLTFTVSKTAAGAVEYIKIARVSNIASTLELLKKRGLWIFGADMDGKNYCQSDFKDAMALVIGNEGCGLSRIVKEKCDFLVSLPLLGKTSSLNASVAAGILMYEIAKQRSGFSSI